jgi:hypothetical protein
VGEAFVGSNYRALTDWGLLVPIADLFVSIKAKMIDQAGQDKATVLRKAQLVERLRKLGITKLEAKCSAALIAVGWTPDRISKKMEKAMGSGKQSTTYQENSLIGLLLDTNLDLVEQSIDKWEMER